MVDVNFNHVPTPTGPSPLTVLSLARLVTPAQIARAIQVTEQTVNHWHRDGIIPARVHEGRIARFYLSEVLEALRQKDSNRYQIILPVVTPQESPGLNRCTSTDCTAMNPVPPVLAHETRTNGSPRPTDLPKAPLKTPKQVAWMIQTTPQTINFWHRIGIIPSRVSINGVVRFDLEEVLEVLARRVAEERRAHPTPNLH